MPLTDKSNPKSYKFPRLSSCLLCAIVFLFSLFLYQNSLGGYFQADDLWQVHHAYSIFSGRGDLFFTSFSGNYLQIPGAQFLRPILGLSFLGDFHFWKVNPWGYHLTNILLYGFNCVCVFILAQRLFPSREGAGKFFSRASASNLVPLAAALLFAATPLHCEDTAWISGRADLLAGAFFLPSLLLFLGFRKTGKRHQLVLSFLLGILAMGSKETAVILPAVIFSASLFLREKRDDALASRLLRALKDSGPYIVLALLYLIFRYLCFGTIVGGYGGTFGAGVSQYALWKWLDLGIWSRIIFPYNVYALGVSLLPYYATFAAFSYLVFLFLIRLLRRELPAGRMLFLLSWLFLSLVPLSGFFNIDPYLHGSRVFFFFTMPFFMILAAILFYEPDGPSPTNGKKDQKPGVFPYAASVLSAVTLVTLLFFWGRATVLTNSHWVKGGDAVKAVRQQCLELAARMPESQRAALIGIPGDLHGAFVILNGSTFHHLLSPPLVEKDVSERFITFKPFVFGSESGINPGRLKKILSHPEKLSGVYFCDQGLFRRVKDRVLVSYVDRDEGVSSSNSGYSLSLNSFENVSLKYVSEQDHSLTKSEHSLVLDKFHRGPYLKFAGLTVNPFDYGVLRMTVEAKQSDLTRPVTPLTVSWNGYKENRFAGAVSNNLKHLVHIPLCQSWRWYEAGQIRDLELYPGDSSRLTITSPELIKTALVMPNIDLADSDLIELGTGEFVVRDKKKSLKLRFEAGSIDGADHIRLEVASPNCFFDEQTGAVEILASRRIDALSGESEIPLDFLKEGSYTQVRVVALDGKGRALGLPSCPVTLFLNLLSRNSYIY